MHIADNTYVRMLEDGGAFVFVDRNDVARFANTGDMFGGTPNAEGDVEVGRDGTTRQADLLLFGEPALVGDVTCGADGGVEQSCELVDGLVVLWFAHAHTHADNAMRRF